MAPFPDQHCDVVIVGAGLSGIAVGESLSNAGLTCIVLEAGPVQSRRLPSCNVAHYRERILPLLAVDEAAWAYKTVGEPFTWLRVRAGGGRSLLWGGWSMWPDAASWNDAAAFDRAWPMTPVELETHLHRAQRWLDVREAAVDPGFDAVRAKLGLAVTPKRAAIGPCGCRAMVSLDRRTRARIEPERIVTELLQHAGSVVGVTYVEPGTRRTGVIRSRAVVLSASPIETTRLLLSQPLATDVLPLIGRGYVDHMVASFLVLLPRPAPSLEPATPLQRAAFVPRFVNKNGHNMRPYRGGFTLELHGPEPLSELGPEGITTLDVDPSEAPALSYYLVHAMGETGPAPERSIDIDSSERDALGRPLPRIHIGFTDEDRRMAADMEETAIAIADALAIPGSRIFPIRRTLSFGGTAHEAGTCPIGGDPRSSVVDLSGQVHGVPGLYIADASLLPSALDRPPTLTVLALALNTADGVLAAARS